MSTFPTYTLAEKSRYLEEGRGSMEHRQILTMPIPESDTHKKSAILKKCPLPAHWEPPTIFPYLIGLQNLVFKVLCICGYGQPNLEGMWAAMQLEEEGDEKIWVEGKQRTSDRLNNILAGLLLATSSVFITTPPPNTSMLNYTLRGPYMCICGAFGILIGAIIVASITVLVINKISPRHTKNVLFRSRICIFCMLVILAYPSLAIAVATLLLAFGFLSAVWCAHDIGFQLGGMILLVLPILIGLLFAFVSIHSKDKSKDETGGDRTSV